MTIRSNGAARRCLAASAVGAFIANAIVTGASAQWVAPWRAAFPGEIAQALEAQGYVLASPLMRRPGIYLADVSAGPAGYQRLVIDAHTGQILERFSVPSDAWAPRLATRDEGFSSSPAAASPPLSGELSSPSTHSSSRSSGVRGADHIPAAISPYGSRQAPLGAKPKTKSALTDRKPSTTRPIDPPLPPAAPREAAKAVESGPPERGGASAPTADGGGGASTASREGSEPAVEAHDDRPRVSIVPPPLFQ
jgi:hypothetical protein